MAVSRRDLHRRSSCRRDDAETTTAAPASACLDICPTDGLPRALPARCAALHLLSDHRAQGTDPARIPRSDRQPHLWLRRLPGGLPLEQVRQRRPRSEAAGARRAARAAAGRSGAARRRRLPRAVSPSRRSSASAATASCATCLIAIGNSGRGKRLRWKRNDLLEDRSPVVRGAAVWALSRLLPPGQFAALARRRAATEGDADVRGEWAAATPA